MGKRELAGPGVNSDHSPFQLVALSGGWVSARGCQDNEQKQDEINRS